MQTWAYRFHEDRVRRNQVRASCEVTMKQPDDMARAQSLIDTADVLAHFLGRLFRKRPVPPPDGWDVGLSLTLLGGIDYTMAPGMPLDDKRLFMTFVRTLAWLYPGPGETKALRELEEARRALGRYSISCQAPGVPLHTRTLR